MAQFIIDGISISFPYEPYEVQKDYMLRVITCLKQGVNGLLESPTGTGKTLSLLCSSLAWLENRKAHQQIALIEGSINNVAVQDLKKSLSNNSCWDEGPFFMLPKIIYSSRTHSQLSQATQELKRSNYRHMKAVVLGSRDQLCLHPDVLKIPGNVGKVHACHAKVTSKSCPFYLNYEEKILSNTDYHESPVTDIEDLVTLGKKHRVCPYYAARKLKSEADIIFTPYNYIIDPKSRRAHGTELQGNVVIFDEAHNIESACEESLSFDLRSYDLALCITEISQAMQMIKDFDSSEFNSSDNGAPDFTLADLSILKVIFCELEEILDKIVAENSSNAIKPGDYMFEILSKVELNPAKKDIVVELLDKIILYHFTASSNTGMGLKGAGLQKFSDLLHVLYSKTSDGYSEASVKQEFATKYKVCIQYELQNNSKNAADPWAASSKKNKSWKLDFWCFSPQVRLQEIKDRGVHSIILTSGTLSPLGPMIDELGVDFPVQLENPHIIKKSQVFVAIIPFGPDGVALNSSYQNRSNEAYVSSLGRTICNFSRVVPDGFLVFFPSYSVMKSNQETWEDNGIWRTLSGIKPVFTEPQGKDAFQESIDKFYGTIQDPSSKGATLMAVCRGKVSEGLDFADQNARAVVITGLPFPPMYDLKVKLKMEYLNTLVKENKGQKLNGNDWYMLKASRAVNQAIGRVIRHKNDFGAILLCDNRFQQNRIQQQLSRWIHGHICSFDSFGPALRKLSTFFKSIDQESLKPKPVAQGSMLGSFSVNGSILISNVASGKHAASSQQTKLTENRENIFETYKTSVNEGTASTSKKANSSSIFEEFEKTKHQPVETSSKSDLYSDFTTTKGVPSISSQSKELKRRKICVQLRSACEPESENGSVAEKWKKFLLEIKTLFKTSDKYGKFCCAVKEYKVAKDVQKFALALAGVFVEVPDKQKYIQTASLLVDSKHRQAFLSICI